MLAVITSYSIHYTKLYELISGAKEGVICYDKRERNVSLETDLAVSISLLNTLIDEVSCIDDTAFIVVKADYSRVGQAEKEIASSVSRELAYCIEHSIHHQALIKAVLIMSVITSYSIHYTKLYEMVWLFLIIR